MDFLDSLDSDAPKYKKSRRVRSWYLYEQFKSLERNQLDAARKLKSRSYQDRILRQELTERRLRRKLYDQIGQSHSECGIETKSTKTSLNISSDDFESFHELLDDEGINKPTVYDYAEDDSSRDSRSVKDEDNTNKGDDHKDGDSCAGSVDSVIEVKSEETLTEDIKNIIEIEEKPTFQNVELNFDEVKHKLQCLEKLSRMRDFDKPEHDESLYSIEEDEFKYMHDNKNGDAPENNVYLMWTKLVSFAYQLMELNHGNCYYDYGSQLLTAVLACDVLRRGINSMCYVLQPYVSPLQYNTDSDSDMKQKNAKRKKQRRYSRKKPAHTLHNTMYSKKKQTANSTMTSCCCLEKFWKYSSPFSKDRLNSPYRRNSEPNRRITKHTTNTKYPTTKSLDHYIWPYLKSESLSSKSLRGKCCCNCCQKVENPMLHLSWYLDRIMREIDDPII